MTRKKSLLKIGFKQLDLKKLDLKKLDLKKLDLKKLDFDPPPLFLPCFYHREIYH